jgi:hypothetical protein
MLSPVSGFKNYIISNDGVIYSQKGEMKQQIKTNGYKRIELSNKGQKKFYIHRLVYQHFGKNWNPELTVDHIDGNPLNNHISNLRMATQQQQNFNTKVRKSKLGVKGVRKMGKKYSTEIRINGKITHLGTFDTIEEASEAYQTKAKELHGEFYRG